MQKVMINGKQSEVPSNTSVLELVKILGYTPSLIAIECDGDILPKAKWDSKIVQEGQCYEIVHFVGGG